VSFTGKKVPKVLGVPRVPRVLKWKVDIENKNCDNEKHEAWSSNSSEQEICAKNSIIQKEKCKILAQIAPCPMRHAPCKEITY
jgi:3-deoxy-D-manno-octulosonic-acid transferase